MKHLTLLLAALCAPSAFAQTHEYDVIRLGEYPGAASTFGIGMNDRGEVVGWSQFFGSMTGVKGWHWSATTGYTLLPHPAGMASYRAVDINDDGAIAGDGGYDSGFLWRHENGTTTVLGALPSDGRSIAYAMNEAEEIAGTSFGFQLIVPKKAVLALPGQALQEIHRPAEATAINELGQVAGWTTATNFFTAFRYDAASGLQLLPPLGSNANHYPADINNHGDVVGSASAANGNGGVPFLYTDAGGMQMIGNFGGSAGASGINDDRVVIGNFSASGTQPWVWTQSAGLRFLQQLIDPTANVTLRDTIRINERGDILARVWDPTTFRYSPAILRPRITDEPGFAYCFGEACPCGDERLAGCRNSTGSGGRLDALGSPSLASDDATFEATGLPAGGFGIVFAGRDATSAPLGDGRLCLAGSLSRFPVRPVGAGGNLVESLGAAGHLGVVAGETWRFQCWYRDAVGCTGAGFNVTNAYEITFE